jgi:hypothetical protein
LRNQRWSITLWPGTGWRRFRAYPRACAFPQFSVKVVRHRIWNSFCGRLWKSDGNASYPSGLWSHKISNPRVPPISRDAPPLRQAQGRLLQRTQGWGTLSRNDAIENIARRVEPARPSKFSSQNARMGHPALSSLSRPETLVEGCLRQCP